MSRSGREAGARWLGGHRRRPGSGQGAAKAGQWVPRGGLGGWMEEAGGKARTRAPTLTKYRACAQKWTVPLWGLHGSAPTLTVYRACAQQFRVKFRPRRR